MNKTWLLLAISLLFLATCQLARSHPKDDDFAEFEDDEEFETDEFFSEDVDAVADHGVKEGGTGKGVEEESEDGEFFEEDHEDGDEEEEDEDEDVDVEDVLDNEEFEYDGGASNDKSDIKISQSTVAQYSTWHWYYLEILMLLGLVCYLLNYLMGRTRNLSLATTWLETHRELLRNDFTIVGDTGEGESPTEEDYVKQSDSSFVLWCSGRQGCNSMIIQLRLQKRHDLLSLMMNAMRPNPDTIIVNFQLADADMDNYVLAVAKKKTAIKMMKELNDIKNFCPERRSAEKFDLPSSFVVMPEIHETAVAMLSHKTFTSVLQRYESIIDSVHISDQYTGAVDDTAEDDNGATIVKVPERKLIFSFNLPKPAIHGNMQSVEPLMRFALQLLDRVNKYRLSKEGREKAAKNRQRVAQNVQKLSHQQRQEAAQTRKEERKKLEKERLLQETDPDKARKLEEREHKRTLKKQTKMKQKVMRVG